MGQNSWLHCYLCVVRIRPVRRAKAPRPAKRAQMLPWHARGPTETRKCSPYTTFHPWDPREARSSAPGALLGCPGGCSCARGAQEHPPGTPAAPDAARARPRCLAHLPSPARLVARSRPAAARANESSSWTDVFMAARQHWRSRRLTALRFAWYWEDHPLSSRLETPHEPPKRCGLTPANLGE